MQALASQVGRAIGALLALILGTLVGIAAAETVAWAAFGVSWAAAAEIQGLLLVWFGLLGAVYGIHTRAHLGVEVLTRRLPSRWRAAAARLVSLLVAIFGFLLTVYGAQLVTRVTNTLPATGLSAAVQYFPTVICGGLMVFFALAEAVADLPPRTTDLENATDDLR